MSEKYGVRINRYGRERACVVKIIKQTAKTYTYVDKQGWRPTDPHFAGRETRVHEQPAAVCDTLPEAERLALAANAAWDSFRADLHAAQEAYLSLGKHRQAAFEAALSGGAEAIPASNTPDDSQSTGDHNNNGANPNTSGTPQ